MTFAALALAAGVTLLQWQAELPSLAWGMVLVPLGLLVLRWRFLAPVLAFAAGFFWAALLAHARMGDWLPPSLEGRDLRVAGVVVGLPGRTERGVRFELETETEGLPRKLLLSWYGETELHPGERWHLTVRLRRPHGNVNPQGFDYEAWLLERGIGATGYVRSGEPVGRRDGLFDRLEQAREAVRDRFHRALGATPAAGILAALAVGDQRAISAEEWRLFSRTGVTHLMSISGLHVTLVSGLVAWLVSAGWRRVPALALRLPARKAAALAAIAAALGYTLLAGFAVMLWMKTLPAERWMAALFQVTSASTTVGFNTVPIGALSPASVMLLITLMIVGASPAGTGGGLKTTTVTAIWAVMTAVSRKMRYTSRRLSVSPALVRQEASSTSASKGLAG